MNDHPDVTAYAQFEAGPAEMARVEQHLKECGDCRDLVLFIRKTNTTLLREGRIARVAQALGITADALKNEMRKDTSIKALVNRPPESPVPRPTALPDPVAPAKK